MAADGEGLFCGVCWFECYSGWGALPGGGGAGGIGGGIFRDGLTLQGLFQDWLPAADLGYYGVEFFAVFGDAAVGGVIAVPAYGRVEGVELGEIDGGDAGGGAVDQEPAAALPLPVRRLGGLLGKAVVDAENAPDYEEAVGNFVSWAQGEFLDVGVDQERSNF